MFRKSIASAATVVAFLAGTTALSAETLGDALVSAYTSSDLLDQNRALLRAADEDVAQAIAGLRPTLAYKADASLSSATKVWEETYQLIASLTVYDGGANQLTVRAKEAAVMGTRQELVSYEQDVLLDAVTAYLGVQTAREYVALRESNVGVLTQELRAAQDRFDVGEVTRTDVSLAEAQLASARSLLAVAQGDLVTAGETFRVAVGHAPTSLSAAPRASMDMTQDAAVQYALRNHPGIKSLQHAVSAAETGIEIARAAQRPTMELQAGVGASRTDHSEVGIGRAFSATISGPIYSGGAISSAIRKAQDQRDSYRAQLHSAAMSVEQGVVTAFASYRAAVSASEAYSQGVDAAQLAFDGVREEANAGARTTIDVLNAEQSLLDARASLVDAQANVVLASYGILYAMGLMTVDHLDLPVTRYDVEGHFDMVRSAPTASSPQGQALDRVLDALR